MNPVSVCSTFLILFVLYAYLSVYETKDLTVTLVRYSNQSKETSSDDEFMEIMKVRHQERIQQARSICQSSEKYKCLLSDAPNVKSLYSEKYKYTICRIQKVASSNWLRAVLVMDEFHTVDDAYNHKVTGADIVQFTYQHRQLNKIHDTAQIRKIWDESLNIITVRNPFERLVSAYRDKFVTKENATHAVSQHYHVKVARQVQSAGQRYRKDPQERGVWYRDPTFEDFVNYLVHSDPDKKYDVHWMTYMQHCKPCIFKYDVIVKLETQDSDMKYLRRLLNVPEKFNDVFLMPKRPAAYDFREYYRNLDPELISKLYKIHEIDFKIFGYPRPKFVPEKCVSHRSPIDLQAPPSFIINEKSGIPARELSKPEPNVFPKDTLIYQTSENSPSAKQSESFSDNEKSVQETSNSDPKASLTHALKFARVKPQNGH